MCKKTNIPKIIRVKFHGFIFLAIAQRFGLLLLTTKEKAKAVHTARIVAISFTGRVSAFFNIKSRSGAIRMMPRGMSSFFKENELE